MSQTKSNASDQSNDKKAANKNESSKIRSVSRFAKKSTNAPEPSTTSTRGGQPKRLAALATKDKLLNNFNPDTSNREKRKLERKFKTKPLPGAVFDSAGSHIATGVNLCDCLELKCPGCFFPCKKCSSPKCGPDCRNNRKIIYESIEFHGFSHIQKNPLEK